MGVFLSLSEISAGLNTGRTPVNSYSLEVHEILPDTHVCPHPHLKCACVVFLLANAERWSHISLLPNWVCRFVTGCIVWTDHNTLYTIADEMIMFVVLCIKTLIIFRHRNREGLLYVCHLLTEEIDTSVQVCVGGGAQAESGNYSMYVI